MPALCRKSAGVVAIVRGRKSASTTSVVGTAGTVTQVLSANTAAADGIVASAALLFARYGKYMLMIQLFFSEMLFRGLPSP